MARSRLFILLSAALLLLPASTLAQSNSGIAGVVKDTSGAVLPGVTVEAASPALIEKVRTVVTDGAGQYKIVELRPGSYTVTFTLAGFSSVRQQGIELTASFTATVNADMRVGTLEETITVTGEAPTVDVQNVVQQRVMTRDIINAVPAGTKSAMVLGVLIPGVTTISQDVGGTIYGSAAIAIHNSRAQEMQLLHDGMAYNNGWEGRQLHRHCHQRRHRRGDQPRDSRSRRGERGERHPQQRDSEGRGKHIQGVFLRHVHERHVAERQPDPGAEGPRSVDGRSGEPHLRCGSRAGGTDQERHVMVLRVGANLEDRSDHRGDVLQPQPGRDRTSTPRT